MESVVEVEGFQETIKNKGTEIVERKGLGHPDSLCDGIAESISRELSRRYIEVFGSVLHHNTDEIQLIAGRSEPSFGGGELIEPIQIILAGRATKQVEGKSIDIDRIAKQTTLDYLDKTLDAIDIDEDVKVESRIGEGSTELKEVVESKTPRANDTSFGVGYAPLSETENVVLEVEKSLQEADMDGVGEDIKVMGKRHKDSLDLTVAVATISRYIEDINEYISLIDEVENLIYSVGEKNTGLDLDVEVNVADEINKNSIYMTEIGTSAEMGDDGSVGRGNRINGLITPCRNMSLEAASGKNPSSHIGKVYNLLSHEIAQNIVDEISEINEAVIKLVSQIGSPIDKPSIASIQVNTKNGVTPTIKENTKIVLDENLDNIQDLTKRSIEGEIKTF